MIKTYRRIIYLILLPLLLTGCWDYRDIDDRNITLSVGVDYIDGNIEFTGESAKLISSSSGQEKAKITDVYTYNSVGKYFEGAREEFDAKFPTPDFSGAVRSIVFSKKYAEKGIESYINRLNSLPQYRNSLLIVISEEPTKELFKGKVENDISIGYAIEDTIRHLTEEEGVALYKTGQQIISSISIKDANYLIPYITKDKNTIKYLGLAVMKDSRLVSIIKRENSKGFLFILSEKPISIDLITSPTNKENLLSIKSTLKKRNIKTSYEQGKVNIYIDLKLNSQLQYGYKLQSFSDEDIKKIENMISHEIKKEVMYALERSKNDFKCDVFEFVKYFRADNYEKYKNISWREEYQKANFYVNVETTITNTGLLDTSDKKDY